MQRRLQISMAWVLIVCASRSRPTSQETHAIGPEVFAFPPKTGPSKKWHNTFEQRCSSFCLREQKVPARPTQPSAPVSAQQVAAASERGSHLIPFYLCVLVSASSFADFLRGHQPRAAITTSPSSAFFTQTAIIRFELVTLRQEPLPSKER